MIDDVILRMMICAGIYFIFGVFFCIIIFMAPSTKDVIEKETTNNLFVEEISYGSVILVIIIVFTIAAWPYYFLKSEK